MREQILSLISEIPTPGFFVIAEFSQIGKEMPSGIERFIVEKLKVIGEGVRGRKFVFLQSEWRIIFTFFPTDSVVEERYALKNKIKYQ